MFEKVNIPIIGIVENMAMHTCSKCGNEEHIFGSGGAEKMCRDYGVSLLGSLPLDIKIREQSDNGNPTVVAEPESSAAKTYKKIARLTAIKVSKLAQDYSNKFPNIVIQKT
jgi:ATP-binding protein involved in chromosome partitioning